VDILLPSQTAMQPFLIQQIGILFFDFELGGAGEGDIRFDAPNCF
jgi:hypothetical protein